MTSPQVAFNFDDLPDSIPRERIVEALKFRELLSQMDRIVKKDSIWFIVGKQWLSQWERYNYVDLIDGNKLEMSDDERNAKPGKINNEEILFQVPKG